MALISPHKAPNSAEGNYFRILRAVFICAPGELEPRWEIWLGFYASEEARDANTNPMYQYQVNVPVTDLPEDPRVGLYALLKQSELFVNQPVADQVEDEDATPLEVAKKAKKLEISKAKILANQDCFMFRGVKFQANQDAMLQIQTTMNGILARGTLRDDWNGAWLAYDNTPFPIPDVETWFAFYDAIEQTGQANFDRAVALKALIDQATALNQLTAIHWKMDPMVLPEAQADTALAAPEPAPAPAQAGVGSPPPAPEGIFQKEPTEQ